MLSSASSRETAPFTISFFFSLANLTERTSPSHPLFVRVGCSFRISFRISLVITSHLGLTCCHFSNSPCDKLRARPAALPSRHCQIHAVRLNWQLLISRRLSPTTGCVPSILYYGSVALDCQDPAARCRPEPSPFYQQCTGKAHQLPPRHSRPGTAYAGGTNMDDYG